jgi:hypothetical protein
LDREIGNIGEAISGENNKNHIFQRKAFIAE